MTVRNNPVPQTPYSPPPDWMTKQKNSSPVNIVKSISKIFLSIVGGFVSGAAQVAWLILGVFLAANYFQPLTGLRDAIVPIWRVLLVLVIILVSWINIRELNR